MVEGVESWLKTTDLKAVRSAVHHRGRGQAPQGRQRVDFLTLQLNKSTRPVDWLRGWPQTVLHQLNRSWFLPAYYCRPATHKHCHSRPNAVPDCNTGLGRRLLVNFWRDINLHVPPGRNYPGLGVSLLDIRAHRHGARGGGLGNGRIESPLLTCG